MVTCVGESEKLPFSSYFKKRNHWQQTMLLIQRFYSQLLRYNLPVNAVRREDRMLYSRAKIQRNSNAWQKLSKHFTDDHTVFINHSNSLKNPHIWVVIGSPIGPNQSQRSRNFLDQSASSIQPMWLDWRQSSHIWA